MNPNSQNVVPVEIVDKIRAAEVGWLPGVGNVVPVTFTYDERNLLVKALEQSSGPAGPGRTEPDAWRDPHDHTKIWVYDGKWHPFAEPIWFDKYATPLPLPQRSATSESGQ